MTRRSTTAVPLVFLLALVLALVACTPSKDAPTPAPSQRSDPGAAPPPPPEVRPLGRVWRTAAWARGGLPRWVPGDAAALPGLLADPHPARLVHHPVERLDDTAGWAGEQLLFFGDDGRWRRLTMADLGLPDAWWPGSDTYGSGALSPDGATWAAHTNAGIALVDLHTGSVRHVDFPAGARLVRSVTWLPVAQGSGPAVLSAYARGPNARRYRTFHLDTRGRLQEVGYPGDRARFDVDGTPVELVRSGRRELTVRRWEATGVRSSTWQLGAGLPGMVGTAFGVFGDTHVAFYRWGGGQTARIWVLDKHTGAMTAQLRVPGATSIEGWSGGALLLLVDNRALIEWEPHTGRIRRVLELPGTYPVSGEWAAATIALPAR